MLHYKVTFLRKRSRQRGFLPDLVSLSRYEISESERNEKGFDTVQSRT